MFKRLRMALLAVGSVLVFASNVAAQISQPVEIRFDLVELSFDPLVVDAIAPGVASVGLFFSERLAVEGSIGLSADDDFWGLMVGASVPFHLSGDFGRSGFFVAPALEISKFKDMDLSLGYGLDAGFSMPATERASWRFAAILRDGDNYGDLTFGLRAGISILFR